MNRSLLILLGACALMATACAEQMMSMESATPTMERNTAVGMVLTDAKSMTLYIFDKDTPGKSNCKGKCAKAWPPLMASSGSKQMGDYTVITRDDGSKQWAYKGMPLYTWFKDKKPGDTTGDGVGGKWHVAKP